MNKVALLTFLRNTIKTNGLAITSKDLAQVFEIPRNEAAGYLCKAHGRNYVIRRRIGREFWYYISPAGLKVLDYWEPRLRVARLLGTVQDSAPDDVLPLTCPDCHYGVQGTVAAAVAGVWCGGCGKRMTMSTAG